MLACFFLNMSRKVSTMKKLFPLILCLFVKVATYANPECPCPLYAIPCPAVCESCDNAYYFVDLLFWKAQEDGIAWAASQTANLQLRVSPTTAKPRSHWKPGLRIGLGYECCDGLDFSLAYTGYYSKAKDSKTFNETTNVAFGLFDTNPSAGGHANWRLNYNTFDLAIKQPFCIGERVILSPSLSLYGGCISDKYIIDNILPGTPPLSSNLVKNKQKFSFIGPKLGCNSIWNLTNCWSIFGEGSIALLWGHYRVSRFDTHTDTGVTTVVDNLKNKFNTLRLVPAYSIGILWNESICNGKYCVEFKLAWEQQIWLQHNQMFLLSVPNDNTLLFNNTNLSLYGLTVGCRVQF